MSTDNGGTMDNPPTHRELLQRAPSTVVVLATTVVVLAVIGSFVALILADKSTESLVSLIERGVGLLGALTGAGGLVFGASAARSSAAAQQQTNGSLDARMRTAVAAGIAQALDGQEPTAPAPGIPAPRDPSE